MDRRKYSSPQPGLSPRLPRLHRPLCKWLQDKGLEGARKTWRRLAGQNQLPKLIANVKFEDRIKASPPQAKTAA